MVYKFGLENRLIEQSPTSVVKVPKPQRGERIMPLTAEEVEHVADESSHWASLVRFMADSGARPAEAIALEWRHVDLESATVELASKNSKTELSWRT